MAHNDPMEATRPLQTVAENLADMGSQAGEIAQEQYERLKAGAAELIHDGRERVQELEESLEQYIAEHPIKSMLIAAGVGLLVGRCLLR